MRAAAESRRKLVFALALLSLLALPTRGAIPTPALAADNPITIENQQTGSNSTLMPWPASRSRPALWMRPRG